MQEDLISSSGNWYLLQLSFPFLYNDRCCSRKWLRHWVIYRLKCIRKSLGAGPGMVWFYRQILVNWSTHILSLHTKEDDMEWNVRVTSQIITLQRYGRFQCPDLSQEGAIIETRQVFQLMLTFTVDRSTHGCMKEHRRVSDL